MSLNNQIKPDKQPPDLLHLSKDENGEHLAAANSQADPDDQTSTNTLLKNTRAHFLSCFDPEGLLAGAKHESQKLDQAYMSSISQEESQEAREERSNFNPDNLDINRTARNPVIGVPGQGAITWDEGNDLIDDFFPDTPKVQQPITLTIRAKIQKPAETHKANNLTAPAKQAKAQLPAKSPLCNDITASLTTEVEAAKRTVNMSDTNDDPPTPAAHDDKRYLNSYQEKIDPGYFDRIMYPPKDDSSDVTYKPGTKSERQIAKERKEAEREARYAEEDRIWAAEKEKMAKQVESLKKMRDAWAARGYKFSDGLGTKSSQPKSLQVEGGKQQSEASATNDDTNHPTTTVATRPSVDTSEDSEIMTTLGRDSKKYRSGQLAAEQQPEVSPYDPYAIHPSFIEAMSKRQKTLKYSDEENVDRNFEDSADNAVEAAQVDQEMTDIPEARIEAPATAIQGEEAVQTVTANLPEADTRADQSNRKVNSAGRARDAKTLAVDNSKAQAQPSNMRIQLPDSYIEGVRNEARVRGLGTPAVEGFMAGLAEVEKTATLADISPNTGAVHVSPEQLKAVHETRLAEVSSNDRRKSTGEDKEPAKKAKKAPRIVALTNEEHLRRGWQLVPAQVFRQWKASKVHEYARTVQDLKKWFHGVTKAETIEKLMGWQEKMLALKESKAAEEESLAAKSSDATMAEGTAQPKKNDHSSSAVAGELSTATSGNQAQSMDNSRIALLAALERETANSENARRLSESIQRSLLLQTPEKAQDSPFVRTSSHSKENGDHNPFNDLAPKEKVTPITAKFRDAKLEAEQERAESALTSRQDEDVMDMDKFEVGSKEIRRVRSFDSVVITGRSSTVAPGNSRATSAEIGKHAGNEANTSGQSNIHGEESLSTMKLRSHVSTVPTKTGPEQAGSRKRTRATSEGGAPRKIRRSLRSSTVAPDAKLDNPEKMSKK